MSIKRFFAKTTSEALRKVRDMLGPDAIILSNRTVDGGIEILASHHGHISSLIPDQAAAGPEEAARLEAPSSAPFSPFSSFSPSRPAVGTLPGKETQPRRDEQGNVSPTVSFSSWKDSLKRIEPGNTPKNDPGRWNAVSLDNVARKPLPDPVLDSSVQRPSTVVSEPGAARLPEAALPEEPVKRALTRKTRELPVAQAEMDSLKLGSGKKRLSPSRKAAVAKIAPDTSSVSSKKTRQTPIFDAQRLAEEVTAGVVKEISSMRSALEHQLTLLNWHGQGAGGPTRGGLLSRLLNAGFSARFAHSLLQRLTDVPGVQNDEKQAMAHIHGLLAKNLGTIESEDEILEKGGIYALVGPTGVGKTTTTAKLGARCVIRHGVEKLALITTDGYRIGGHEQLRIYGKILGVPVHAVRDAQDLTATLAELRGKHMVLIDTVGMSQRDERVAEQVAMFAQCGTQIKRLLLLNASSSLQTLNEVAGAYHGNGLAGAIITKVDEAVVSGCALETAICHRLPLYYVSTGQRVPEDLELADSAQLVRAALESSVFTDSLPPDLFLRVARQGKRTGTHRKMAGVALD